MGKGKGTRAKLLIEFSYLGTNFCGWQAQGGADDFPSAQEVLHAALLKAGIDNGPVAAGRLDRGVHAKMQLVTVSTFHKECVVSGGARDAALATIRDVLNASLPADMRVWSVRDAAVKAHAVTCSGAKTYSYYIVDGDAGADPGGGCRRAAHATPCLLDVAAMRRAAATMEGEHDFASLCSAPPSQATVRALSRVEVRRMRHVTFPLLGCLCQPASPPAGDPPTAAGKPACAHFAPESCPVCAGAVEPSSSPSLGGGSAAANGRSSSGGCIVELRFTAPGFLRHQVRRMAGLLIAIGSGKEDEAVVALALQPAAVGRPQPPGPDDAHESGASPGHTFAFPRCRAPPAPAAGLWLDTVEYGSLLGGAAPPAKRPGARAHGSSRHDCLACCATTAACCGQPATPWPSRAQRPSQ